MAHVKDQNVIQNGVHKTVNKIGMKKSAGHNMPSIILHHSIFFEDLVLVDQLKYILGTMLNN